MGSGGAAFAQVIPDSTVRTSPVLNADQRRVVGDFASAVGPRLTSDTPAEISRARDAIIESLADRATSAAYRLELGRGLEAVLNAAARDDRELVAVNALTVAGRLATESSLSLVENGLASPRVAVRYVAANAVGLAFDEVMSKAPAIQPDRALQLAARMGDLFATEPDVHVCDRMVRSLAVGASSGQTLAGLRAASSSALSSGLTRRIRELGNEHGDDETLRMIVRAVQVVSSAVEPNQPNPLSEAVLREAAGAAGDALAYARRLIDAGQLPVVLSTDPASIAQEKQEQRRLTAQLVAVSEAAVFFARQSTAAIGVQINKTSLAEYIRAATNQSDARFKEDVGSLIGPQGALCRPPFSFPINRFN